MIQIDTGLVLYVGMGALLIWRYVFGWKCCGGVGRWVQYANYCSLFIALLIAIVVYDSMYFFKVAYSDYGKAAWDKMPSWLPGLILVQPGFVIANTLLSAYCTFDHVERIREESAVQRHDRAVQIILLPAVYSTMAYSCTVRIYEMLGNFKDPYALSEKKTLDLSLARGSACFFVGDLYEAWALYQFLKLTLEVIKTNLEIRMNKDSGQDAVDAAKAEEDASKARGAIASHEAVVSLAWLGLVAFLLICVAEAGFSLCMLTFESGITAAAYNKAMSMFSLAGFLYSCVAIYNVAVVETSFHDDLEGYSPVYKFITVKILVTFAFVQKGFFNGIGIVASMLPKSVSNWIQHIPFLGDFVHFQPNQFQMFYSSLIIIECFVMAILHVMAWRADEAWYDQYDEHIENQDIENADKIKGNIENADKIKGRIFEENAYSTKDNPSYNTFLKKIGAA